MNIKFIQKTKSCNKHRIIYILIHMILIANHIFFKNYFGRVSSNKKSQFYCFCTTPSVPYYWTQNFLGTGIESVHYR